jgi:hypothetical protein
LTLASSAILFVAVPLWAIAAAIPWPAACGAMIVYGLFVPLVNAPLMGLLSTRPPVGLRPKVLTAVMTASGLGSPVGRLVVGPLFSSWGNAGVWLGIAGGLTVGALLFATAAVRGTRREARGSGSAPPLELPRGARG